MCANGLSSPGSVATKVLGPYSSDEQRMLWLQAHGYFEPLWWRYLAWLGKEITKSNWDVAKLVIAPSLPITPTMIWVPASQRSDVGKVIYANSITLTPGTVSVELEHGQVLVHAIAREAAEAVQSGEMDRRVCAIEER